MSSALATVRVGEVGVVIVREGVGGGEKLLLRSVFLRTSCVGAKEAPSMSCGVLGGKVGDAGLLEPRRLGDV